ncbi:MAG: GmrSD restriction endonuclease domain-containing protein [Steroidobacteraceae bacterium]
MIGASFDSTKTPLYDLLGRADSGKLQLPDFQRGWVWDDERIRSLLASVSVSFPIGAVMLLETGGEHIRFKPRPLAGTHARLREVAPETLILDGQQRLTSLYQALKSQVVVETKDAKGKPIRRWYYLDMKQAVIQDDDREDAVLSVPEDRQAKAFGGEITLDVTTPEREYAADLFPVNCIFDSAEWRQAYSEHWKFDRDKMRLFNDFEREVIKRFEQYQVPVIELKKQTPKEAVCLVFERVNTGGVALSVFELLTASFAADDFQLRDDWNAREQRLKGRHPVLRGLQSDDFLQAVSLLVTQTRRRDALAAGSASDKAPGISCKRKDILKLEVADWQTWAERVEVGFVRAARFLYGQKIFKARDLPYRTQLVPLAAMFVDLGKDGETEGARQKIARWYWCGVLGELYGGAIESRFARDLPEVVAMVRGEATVPITIQESSFQPNRLLTLRTRNSSAYKGLYALLMRNGGRDFRTGEPIEAQTFFDDKVDIHHIFPEKWCKTTGIEPDTYNSVINKTALAARTNRQIGGRAPSLYLPAVEKAAGIGTERMDEILRSHCIAPNELRADRFWEFYAARAETLLQRIEAATGKTITREPALFRAGVIADAYDEGPAEWDVEEPLEEAAP